MSIRNESFCIFYRNIANLLIEAGSTFLCNIGNNNRLNISLSHLIVQLPIFVCKIGIKSKFTILSRYLTCQVDKKVDLTLLNGFKL